MTDYATLRKEMYEKFHDTFQKLYVSELNDAIADKNAEIESLKVQIRGLQRQLDHQSWLVDKYKDETDDRPKW